MHLWGTKRNPRNDMVGRHPKSPAAYAALAVLLCAALFSLPAQAGFGSKDAQVMARVLGFMDQPPPATVNLGVVYDPGNAASQKEAESLVAQLGGGFAAGKFTLVPKLVKIGDVGGASMNAFVLTSGVGGSAKLADATKSKKIPCFTGDHEAVSSGNCLIGITTDPKVEILLNKGLAAASGITFGSAFRMMITEI
jgi:hypothetical protein